MIDESKFRTYQLEKFDGRRTDGNSDPDRGIVKLFWLFGSKPSHNSRWREKFDEKSGENFSITAVNNKNYLTSELDAKGDDEKETKSEIKRLDSKARDLVEEINSEIEIEKTEKLKEEERKEEAKNYRREYFPRVFEELEEELN